MTDQQTPAKNHAKTIQTRGHGTRVGLRALGTETEHLPPDAPLELYEMTAAVRSFPKHKLDLLKVAIYSGLTGQLMNMPVPYPRVFSGSPMRETVIYRMDDPVQFAFKNEFSTDEVTVDLCCSVRRPPIQQVDQWRDKHLSPRGAGIRPADAARVGRGVLVRFCQHAPAGRASGHTGGRSDLSVHGVLFGMAAGAAADGSATAAGLGWRGARPALPDREPQRVARHSRGNAWRGRAPQLTGCSGAGGMMTVDTVDEKDIRLFQTSVLAMANDPSYEDGAFRRSMREVIRRMFERHSSLRAEFGLLAYVLDLTDDPQAVKLMELLGAMGSYCSTRAAMFADLQRLVGEAKIDLDLVCNNALAEKMKSLHPAIPRIAPDGWSIARLWGNGTPPRCRYCGQPIRG